MIIEMINDPLKNLFQTKHVTDRANTRRMVNRSLNL